MLNATQQATLQAALNRIIPADDYPNAWEAGVGDYLFRQFAGDLRSLLPVYQSGLDALDAEAQTRFSAPFAQLAEGDQDALLRQVEAGTVQTSWPAPPEEFFAMLVNHAAEGYYSDPGNGGNHNALAWEMIGFQIQEKGQD